MHAAANNVMFGIDYGEKKDSTFSFMINQTFTVYDWFIWNKISQSKNIDIGEIEQEQAVELCFNIWPKQMSIMHNLSDEHSDTANFIRQLFELVNNAREKVRSNSLNLQKDKNLCVPFFKNA